jgi:hypothetical protein
MSVALPANHEPADLPTCMAPRLIELCFQTAGLWEIGMTQRMGLPQHIDRVITLRDPEGAPGVLYAVVTANAGNAGFDAHVVDAAGTVYLTLEGYRTVELPQPIDEQELARVRQALQAPAAS